jgi:hypothetical protein
MFRLRQNDESKVTNPYGEISMSNGNNNFDRDLFKEITVEDEDAGKMIMEKPFNPALINIKLEAPTIYNLIDRLLQTPPEIDLYADFQRKDDLWDEGKQSRLIESILIKLPLPAFYFDGTNDNKWLVVDGLQRLSALRNFIIKKSLRLTGLEFLKDFDGYSYDELPRSLKRLIETTQITAHIINPGTPAAVKFNIFKRINTGGLVLEPQEIRHALNQGVPAKFVAELAKSKEFMSATEGKIDSSRMLDREFATRFVAFYMTEPKDYTPDLDSFLNNAMAALNSLSENERNDIQSAFVKSMQTANYVFGQWAFRKADKYPERRKPISKALFDVWSVALAKLTDEERLSLVKQKGRVLDCFAALCVGDPVFWSSITSSTGEKNKVNYRFTAVQNLVKGVLYD